MLVPILHAVNLAHLRQTLNISRLQDHFYRHLTMLQLQAYLITPDRPQEAILPTRVTWTRLSYQKIAWTIHPATTMLLCPYLIPQSWKLRRIHPLNSELQIPDISRCCRPGDLVCALNARVISRGSLFLKPNFYPLCGTPLIV